MSTFLKEDGGFDVVRTYTDENNSNKVTGQSIVNSIYKLAIDSHRYNLDKVWIHYSGHGCMINDQNGDESDNKDECIVPADYYRGGVITDDLIKRVLRYFNTKTKITCVFDCCHSGTIGDLTYVYRIPSICLMKENLHSKRCLSNVLLLSGCMDHQTSADAWNVQGKKQFSGAMTSCLLISMKESSKVFEVFEKLKKLLQQKSFTQIPLLTSSYKIDWKTTLF